MASQGAPQVKLLIRNPASHEAFSLEVDPDSSLGEVQRLLSLSYEGNPQPQHQTVREEAGVIWTDHVLRCPPTDCAWP